MNSSGAPLRSRAVNRTVPPTQSLYEMLIQGRAQKSFNIQELIAAVDQELDGNALPKEPLDCTGLPDSTFERYVSQAGRTDKKIGGEIGKNSRKLFNRKMVVFADDGREAFGMKNEDIEMSRQLVQTKAAGDSPDLNKLVAMYYSQRNRAKNDPEKPDLSSPRPKERRSFLVNRQYLGQPPLTDLFVLGGAFVSGVNPNYPHQLNTFAKPNNYCFGARNEKHFLREIEMYGFKDEEIFFKTDDFAIVIIGCRRARDGLNARKVTEVQELPSDLYPENLRVSRYASGSIVIEQAISKRQ